MTFKQPHILVVFILVLASFILYNLNITYNVSNTDYFKVASIQYGYANIFKQYFFDFYNSFYLYDAELGYDHSYYHFSHFNPFYFLSFFGLGDYSIRASNLFAIMSASFFLFRIAKISNCNLYQTYMLTILPVIHASMIQYTFNQPGLNSLMFIWLYVLFFFDLKNGSVNYYFYVFFLLFVSLTSSYILIFHIIILFFILIFFYKYKKEHNSDLIFFIISNIAIWFIPIASNLLPSTNLSIIHFLDVIKIALFIISFYLIFTLFFTKLSKVTSHKHWIIFLIILFLFFIYLFNYSYILKDLINLLKLPLNRNIITFLDQQNQFNLVSEIRIGSGLFLYIPFGLLIFSFINYKKNSNYFKILIIIFFSIVFFTYIFNSQFFLEHLGTRLLRAQLDYISLVIILFIYFNFFFKNNINQKYLFFKKIKFNRNYFLLIAIVFDLFLLSISRTNGVIHFLFLISLYIPFLLTNIDSTFINKKNFFIFIVFILSHVFLTIEINQQKKSFKLIENAFNLGNYNDFMKCFRKKSDYDKYDRVLATGIGDKERNYIPIMSMLSERERGTDLNILYQFREVFHPKLKNTYKNLLDYRYYGTSKYAPNFYNTKNRKYFFEENFFDQLGVSSVMVFNGKSLFTRKFNSFVYKGYCESGSYKAWIFKSKKPRGSAIFVNSNDKNIKLKHISKNSWDISKLDQTYLGKFVLTFVPYNNTKIFIDDQEVNFKSVKGKLLVPYKDGKVLKIVYQNDYHRLIFILVIMKYFILVIIFVVFLNKNFLKKIKC